MVNAVIATAAAVVVAIPNLELTESQVTRLVVTNGALAVAATLLSWFVGYRRFAPLSKWLAEKTERLLRPPGPALHVLRRMCWDPGC